MLCSSSHDDSGDTAKRHGLLRRHHQSYPIDSNTSCSTAPTAAASRSIGLPRRWPFTVIPNEFVVPAKVQAQRLMPSWMAKMRWVVLRGSKSPSLAVYRNVSGITSDEENPLKVMLLGEDTRVRVAGEKGMVLVSSRVRKNDTWVLWFESSGHRKRMYELVKMWIELSVFLQTLTGFESIARSHNSTVYRCRDNRSRYSGAAHSQYALKRINRVRCWNEIEITERVLAIRALQPYVADYLYMFEDSKDNSVTMVMQYYAGGSLTDRIREFFPLSEHAIVSVLRSLCSALYLLHEHQILHLDVKACNIMFESEHPQSFHNLKLVDFGSSALLTDDKKLKTSGTYGCMAPERFDGRYGPEADVYGAGVVLYHMVVGDIPFSGSGSHQILARNMQGHVSFASARWRSVSRRLRQLAERMLDRSPDTRITLHEILRLRWLYHQQSEDAVTDTAPAWPSASSSALKRSGRLGAGGMAASCA